MTTYIYGMMPTGFFDLPGEIRNIIYEELLVYSNVISLDHAWWSWESSFSHSFERWSNPLHLYPKIFLLSKKAYHEASSVLYSRNCFDIGNSNLFSLFLNQIGSHNSRYLSSLIIPFPDVHFDGHLMDISLKEDSMQTLNLIRLKCDNVVCLNASLHTSHAMELRLDAFDAPRAVDKVLNLIDTQIKAMSSLKEFRINVYDEPIDIALRKKMRCYGWRLEVAQQIGWEGDYWEEW